MTFRLPVREREKSGQLSISRSLCNYRLLLRLTIGCEEARSQASGHGCIDHCLTCERTDDEGILFRPKSI